MPYRERQRVTITCLEELLPLDQPVEPGTHVQANGRITRVILDHEDAILGYEIRLDQSVVCYHEEVDPDDEDEFIERTYREITVLASDEELIPCSTSHPTFTASYKPSVPYKRRYQGMNEEVITL